MLRRSLCGFASVFLIGVCFGQAPKFTISTFAGIGASGFAGDGGAANAANLAFPAGITLDSSGNLYIADAFNSRVRKVDTNGTITTFAGTGDFGYFGDTNAADQGWDESSLWSDAGQGRESLHRRHLQRRHTQSDGLQWHHEHVRRHDSRVSAETAAEPPAP